MSKYLSFYGGDRAISIIRKYGFTQDIVKVVAGAAGGPKWLILGHMDRFLFSEWFSKRSKPLFLAGSSAGAWRFAAASQSDPGRALERLTQAYVHQWYLPRPSLEEIDAQCRQIIDSFIDGTALYEIFHHPFCRPCFFSVRSKGPAQSSNNLIFMIAIAGAALLNLMERTRLRHFFQRALFYHPAHEPPFYQMDEFPMIHVPLTTANFKEALLSSGSIPVIMPGIDNMPDAPEGVYRDGGLIDYHLNIPFLGSSGGQADEIVLFPHYTDRIVPGWLDKKLPWRRPGAENFRNVLMITPSRKFIDMLPGGKIPDRQDFTQFKGKNRKRIERWNIALKYAEILGDELCGIVHSGKVAELIQPITNL